MSETGHIRCLFFDPSGVAQRHHPIVPIQVVGVVGEADVFVVPPHDSDAVIKVDVRCPFAQLTYLKRVGGFVGHIQAFAVAVRHRKDFVVCVGIGGLDEVRIEFDDGDSIDQSRRPEILEPVLRRFDS